MLTPNYMPSKPAYRQQCSADGGRSRVDKCVLLAMAVLSLALASTRASALTLADYEHTIWRGKDGVGGAVIWASPVPNGMLLLRTSNGYQVFDGVEFHSYAEGQPPPFVDHASALGQRSPTGAVYFVDPKTQKLMRAWQGRTELVEDEDNVARLTGRFVFDSQGVGWQSHLGYLYRLEGLKVEVANARWAVPLEAHSNRVAVDRRGTVWVATSSSKGGWLYYLPKGAEKFERFDEPVLCTPFALAPDGAPWCANELGLVAVTLKEGRPVGLRVLSKASHGAIAFDSQGGFWVSSRGVIKHAADWREVLMPGGMAALERDTLSVKEGLSSDGVWQITADSEGNVWIGTGAGLDRFRPTRFRPVKLPRRDFGSALLPDADGSLWVGNWDLSLMRLRDGRIEDIPEVTKVMAIRGDARGGIWIGAEGGIWRGSSAGRFSLVEAPVGVPMPHLRQIAEDDAGAMWFLAGRRLHRLQDGQWSIPEGLGAPPGNQFYILATDLQRQLWFFGEKQGPLVLKGGTLREIKSHAYAKTVGKVYSAYVKDARVWVGHAGGVGAFVGEDFHPLRLKGVVADRITGIVETVEGDLWLHGLARAFRIPADQVEAGLKGQAASAEVFNFDDGLRAATSTIEPAPTLVEDAKGRLWFSTNQGLFWIDPHSTQVQSLAKPPAALIRTVQADGVLSQPVGEVLLPPNPGQVQFGYTAAALGVSNRVRFRYRLQGVDSDWQEAGTRRTAYYTQLAPGRYRFEVAASNERGQWAEVPTSLDIEVRPAWYQTSGFRALLVALSLAFLWALYLLRVGVVARRERARMREILAERERIARDLHDTLLQSMQGVILGFQAVATGLPMQSDTRGSIEGQLDRADQLLGEARDRVQDLRGKDAGMMGLREAFESAAAQLAGSARVEIVEQGRPQPLRPLARDRIYLIGREALLNAVIHGKGCDVCVQLQFEAGQFVLHVRDKGPGIDPAVLAAGERPGHYGLVGMRERAAQMGGSVKLICLPEGGSEVELRVPATQAYERIVSDRVWRKLWRFGGAGLSAH
jgi:signal transduction histidine kinase/ligand-binding sensor domain-containing protein